ncbi:MAG: extracellular solute-binding protein [Deltaproteobacteria bacterium]|nr:extracellular solute-binding protein [Deltaproteobacteria bacterium]
MGTKPFRVFLAGVVILFSVFPARLLSSESQEKWDRLRLLSHEERQKQLLMKAREEGSVVVYSTIETSVMQRLKLGFEQQYPGIKMTVWRRPGDETANRFMTEARAGRFAADVISPGMTHGYALLRTGLIGRYGSPERTVYPDAHKDKEGYWTTISFKVAVLGFNTRLVSQGPRKYEDFLDRRWRGNFAIDMDSGRTVMAMLKMWGEEKTEQFLQTLIKNEVVVRKGHTLITQLLCAGEFQAAVELYASRVAEMKRKGCPIELVYPSPWAPTGSSFIMLAGRAPHPYAAALLTDYLLSKSGQKILVDMGEFAGHPGIKSQYADLDLEGKRVGVLTLSPEDTDALGKKYLQLRERYLMGFAR